MQKRQKIDDKSIFFFKTIFSSNYVGFLMILGCFFNDFFMYFLFGKGMRSRKLDSVKIVLTLEREHENQGLRGCETCSKTIEIDVQTYAKSRMQFGSDSYRNIGRFLSYFFTILGVFW